MPSTGTSAACSSGAVADGARATPPGRPSPRRGLGARDLDQRFGIFGRALGAEFSASRNSASSEPAVFHSGPRVAAVGEALRHGVEGELFGPGPAPSHSSGVDTRASGLARTEYTTPWCGPGVLVEVDEHTRAVPASTIIGQARFAPALDFARHRLRGQPNLGEGPARCDRCVNVNPREPEVFGHGSARGPRDRAPQRRRRGSALSTPAADRGRCGRRDGPDRSAHCAWG